MPDSRIGVSRVILWVVLFVVAALCIIAESHYPYFPRDVSTERWVQALVPGDLSWARAVSQSAEFPWLLIPWALVFALSYAFAGWRAAMLSILSLAGMLLLGMWLGPLVGRARPSPDVVHVMKPLSGYSFPSLSVLVFAATFGFLAILAVVKTSGWRRLCLLLGCLAIFILGGAARIALGAHWPSDVLISYYLGLLWAGFLIRFFL